MQAQKKIFNLIFFILEETSSEGKKTKNGLMFHLANIFESFLLSLEKYLDETDTTNILDKLEAVAEREKGLPWLENTIEQCNKYSQHYPESLSSSYNSTYNQNILRGLCIFYYALIDIRFEAYEKQNKKIYNLIDIIHNNPLSLQRVLYGSSTFEDLLADIRSRVQGKDKEIQDLLKDYIS